MLCPNLYAYLFLLGLIIFLSRLYIQIFPIRIPTKIVYFFLLMASYMCNLLALDKSYLLV